jgi:hypothetical protein
VSDPGDPVHIPGYLALLSSLVLGWMKYRDRNELADVKQAHGERMDKMETRLNTHSARFDTLQTREEAAKGRAELRDDIRDLGDKIETLRGDLLSIVRGSGGASEHDRGGRPRR